MVPEIGSKTEIIFCDFGPFFALLPPSHIYTCAINEDHMIYGPTDRNFHHFGPFFALSAPLTKWKIRILALKKATGDIILHICSINDNHNV